MRQVGDQRDKSPAKTIGSGIPGPCTGQTLVSGDKSTQGDGIANFEFELTGGRAIADSDFKQAAGPDQGQGLAGRHIPIGALKPADALAFDPHLLESGSAKRAAIEVGGCIAKDIKMDDLSRELVEARGGDIEKDRIGDWPCQGGDLPARCQLARHRRHNVAAMKCVTGPRRPPFEFVRLGRLMQSPRPGDQTVIGADNVLAVDLNDENSTVGADAGINHSQVDAAGRKAVDGPFQGDRTAQNVVAGNVVSYIDQSGITALAEQSRFHRGNVVIA